MSVESYRGSPGKFDSMTLSRTTLNRWTGRSLVEGVPSLPGKNSYSRLCYVM